MPPAQNDDDPTIRMVRPVPPSGGLKPRLLIVVMAVAVLLAGSLAVWILPRPAAPVGSASTLSAPAAQSLNPEHGPVEAALSPVEPPPVRGQSATAPAIQVPDGLAAPLADEATILAARAPEMLVFRCRDAPAVLVLSFPSLRQQGYMLDRVAAFVEKAGVPRDRVLADPELDAAIHQSGDTRETYYYGHDYRVADIARFFAAADRDGIVLNVEEVRLRALLQQAGMLSPGAVGAVISIPPVVEQQQIDATSRATILHHELSHGVFFTDPAYAAYARNFWLTVLTDKQRAGIRGFLGSEGYDTGNEDLMLNEAQAYLVHTRDPRYFLPGRAGLSDAEAAALRETFVRGMPDRWLNTSAQANAAK